MTAPDRLAGLEALERAAPRAPWALFKRERPGAPEATDWLVYPAGVEPEELRQEAAAVCDERPTAAVIAALRNAAPLLLALWRAAHGWRETQRAYGTLVQGGPRDYQAENHGGAPFSEAVSRHRWAVRETHDALLSALSALDAPPAGEPEDRGQRDG